MKLLIKIYKKFCDFELFLGAILLISTVFMLTLAAFLRTIGFPINWGLDIALLMFTWSVYVGADTALRNDKMVNVDLIQQNLNPKVKKWLMVFIYTLILLFLALLAYYGFKLAHSSRNRTFQGIPCLSYTWATLSIPIPSLFMILTTALKIRTLIIENSATTSLLENTEDK